MNRNDVFLRVLTIMGSIEKDMDRFGFSDLLVEAVDKAVVVLRAILRKYDAIPYETSLWGLEGCAVAKSFRRSMRKALNAVEELAEDGKLDPEAALVASAVDNAAEVLCDWFNLDYDEFVFGEGDLENIGDD